MLIVKLIGISLIFLSCAFTGFLKRNALAARLKKLLLLFDGVNILYENIEQGVNTLDIAIKNSLGNCGFIKCEKRFFICTDSDLKKDKYIIEEFFCGLGSATKRIECDRINNFKIKLKTQIKDAQIESEQKGKIYGTLGICLGLAIAILLI